jgi:uncharacterized protein
MGLIRLALLIAVVVVGLMLLKRLLAPRAPATPSAATPKLVQCAHCGVHVSEAQAVRSGTRYYCSVEHRQLDHRS